MICVCVLVMDTAICNFVVSEEGRIHQKLQNENKCKAL